ncbi:solute carrier family 28 member 3-like [Mytilus galloprovincialis]|uniref:solute carrier family 28 member 3-like n=1 Tax=Mytilus galloprovincialis TaxID=29158 RepID=UPI003F7C4B85
MSTVKGDSAVPLPDTDLPPRYEDYEEKTSLTINFDNETIMTGIDSDQSDDSDRSSALFASFIKVHDNVTQFYTTNYKPIWKILYVSLFIGYLAYFITAMVKCSVDKVRDPTPLLVLTIVVLAFFVIWFIRKRFEDDLYKAFVQPVIDCFTSKQKLQTFVKILFMIAVIVGMITLIVTSVWNRPQNLISLAGMAVFLIILLICSAHPTKVNWRPVIGGFTLQFFFAAIILKWSVGFQIFEFLGKQVQTFLKFTDKGTEFVFGEKYTEHLFAMKILPVVVFFSCAISVLYYVGAMQIVIGKIAWIMRVTLGTTAAESLCAAGNIFVGQTEAPILIGPFLGLMTKSELNAVMTGGFATIAGGVLAAYISFGVPAEHLLCASVMNAPCALAVSKLLYPETEESKLKTTADLQQEEKKERNILEAAAAGASASIKLVANIAANLIAFIAMLEFVNAVLSWFGSFVGVPTLSFQVICSYVLMPLAYLMGVDWKDAGLVGELIGMKTFLNEFLAYKELAGYMSNRMDCSGPHLSVRSETIATYALCGFANFSSLGMQLGALGPMAPSRKGDLAQIVMRSLLGGIIACLITASVAGLLVNDDPSMVYCTFMSNSSAILNSTVTGVSYNITTILNSTVTGGSFMYNVSAAL